MKEYFDRLSSKVTSFAGSPPCTVAAFAIVAVWFGFGPHFHWSDSYQILINTGTTIVTFLMCFLLQASQNRIQSNSERENKALHLKIDELIRSLSDARDEFRGIETKTDEELAQLAENECDKRGLSCDSA
jgi:low affinity Fe/Cu permease